MSKKIFYRDPVLTVGQIKGLLLDSVRRSLDHYQSLKSFSGMVLKEKSVAGIIENYQVIKKALEEKRVIIVEAKK